MLYSFDCREQTRSGGLEKEQKSARGLAPELGHGASSEDRAGSALPQGCVDVSGLLLHSHRCHPVSLSLPHSSSVRAYTFGLLASLASHGLKPHGTHC